MSHMFCLAVLSASLQMMICENWMNQTRNPQFFINTDTS